MSAARAAARVKPVMVIKAGPACPGAKAAATHTGALAGSDAVYDAAFRRAGLLRVLDLDELFAPPRRSAAQKPFRRAAGDPDQWRRRRRAGGGPRSIDSAARSRSSRPRRMRGARAVLPPTWSHGNPVDIIGDADAARYARALDALLDDRGERRRPGPERADGDRRRAADAAPRSSNGAQRPRKA